MIARPGLEELDPGSVPDGTYGVTVVGGTIVALTIITPKVPQLLTTEVGGVPGLVWDSDNQPVYTEVP